jgi:peptidyl-prolyl cis-trans isomerase D
MLKFLRGKKRSRNVFLIFFVAILTLSLVGLFSVVVSGGASGLFGASGDEAVVASVGGFDVTAKELKDALTAFSQEMAQGQGKGRGENLATTYNLYGTQVMDRLIRQKLLLYEADRLNLGASDSAVQARLRQFFNPWPGGEQYRLRLQEAGMTPLVFEEQLRAQIAQEHITNFVSAAAQVSPSEVEEDYRRTNTHYSVRFVNVTPDKVRDKVAVTDEGLRAFFDSHKDEFKITSEQRRARYIFVDQNKAGDAVQISDDELKQNFNAETYVTQVRVSQIVLNVPKPKTEPAKPAATTNASKPAEKPAPTEETVRTKAQDLVKRAQGAEGKPAEDFATLARDNSEDAKSKSSGGDIGWVNKNDKRDAEDPLSRVFNMKKDEVSQPIKKGDKLYVLKVTDRKMPTFTEVRDRLLKDQRAIKAYSKAVEIADLAAQKFKDSKNAQQAAAEVDKQYGLQLAVVKETPFFSQGDKLPDIGVSPDFDTAVFNLQTPNDIGDRTNVTSGFAIVQYLEQREPHDPNFEEVRAKVDDRYRTDKSKELALERARQVAKAKTVDELKQLATPLGLQVEERAGLPETDAFGPLTNDIDRAPVYKLSVGAVTSEPIKPETGDNYVVVGLMSRKDADMGEQFQKDKKGIEDRLLSQKRDIIVQTYLSETQRLMREAGRIKIYPDAIEKALEGTGAPSVPPGQGRPVRRGPRSTQ